MRNLKNIILSFLRNNCSIDRHYGIGYSGGGDSKALLYLLINNLSKFHIHLHILHIDHNWREESKKEADFLEAEAKKLKIPFYRHTLVKNENIKNNLEDFARNERISFFSKMTKKLDLKGIFLAHHADDLAETVLKRVLEGAHLENFFGMKAVAHQFDTVFLRPFLKVEKKELKLFLINNKLTSFDDSTNYNTLFLRARMRENLFPLIEKNFGKSIKNNLVELAERSILLNSYLDEKLSKIEVPLSKGPFGSRYDFSKLPNLHLLEQNYLLNKIFKKENQSINYQIFAKILSHLLAKSANKKFIFKKNEVICDRGMLFFIVNRKIMSENYSFFIHKKNYLIEPKIGWKHFWEGACYCPVPNENVDIKWFKDLNKLDQKSLLNQWEKKKIPAFLRRKAPIVCQNGKIIQDLLNSKVMIEGLPTYFFEWKIRDYDLIS